MPPTFGPPATTELSLIERTLLRQANLRASERCAVADVDLKTHLAELSSVSHDGQFDSAHLPPNLLLGLRAVALAQADGDGRRRTGRRRRARLRSDGDGLGDRSVFRALEPDYVDR